MLALKSRVCVHPVLLAVMPIKDSPLNPQGHNPHGEKAQNATTQLASQCTLLSSTHLPGKSQEGNNQSHQHSQALLQQTLLQQSLENSQWSFWHWYLEDDRIEADADWWECLVGKCPRESPDQKSENSKKLPSTRREFVEKYIDPVDQEAVNATWQKCLSGLTNHCQVVYRLKVANTTNNSQEWNSQEWAIIERGKVTQRNASNQPIQVVGNQELVDLTAIAQDTQQPNQPQNTASKAIDGNNSSNFDVVTQNLLDSVGQQITQQSDIYDNLKQICEHIRIHLGVERVAIYQLFTNRTTAIAQSPDFPHLKTFPLSEAQIQSSLQGKPLIINTYNSQNTQIHQQEKEQDTKHQDSEAAESELIQLEYLRKLQVKTCTVVPILEFGLGNNDNCTQPRLWGLLVTHQGNSENQLTPSSYPAIISRSSPPANTTRRYLLQPNSTTFNIQTWQTATLKQISLLLQLALQNRRLRKNWDNAIAALQVTEIREQELQNHLELVQSEFDSYKQKLVEKEQSALLGELILSVVNEIQNPINFIYSTLKPVSQHAEDLIRLLEFYQDYQQIPVELITANLSAINPDLLKTELLKQLWSMRAGGDRLQTIISALQQFSQPLHTKTSHYDIHTGINSSLAILQNRLKANDENPGIQVIREFAQLDGVECYPSQINQVFVHLLNNAIDAIEERLQTDASFTPMIRIRTAVHRSHLSVISNTQPVTREDEPQTQRQYFQHKIAIAIFDNGNGMLPHIQRRMFQPFFSTKSHAQGQGLGLTASQYIIENIHNGKIRCQTQYRHSTEFTLELNPTIRPERP